MARHTALAAAAVLSLTFPGAPAADELPADAPSSPAGHVSTGRSASTRPDGGRAAPQRDPEAPHRAPRVSVRPDDGDNRARVDEAVHRFRWAGLRLPDLQVEFSDDGCLGHLGLFDRTPSPWRVNVCSDLEFVLTHELAHAWAAANLDDADRAAYVEFRGLPAWHGPELHWRERGTEDAAFVLQQVLMTEHVRPDWDVWKERAAAYEQLTGRPPPPQVIQAPPPASSADHSASMSAST